MNIKLTNGSTIKTIYSNNGVRGVKGSQMTCMCRDTETHELVLATVDLSKPFTKYIPVWA